MASRKTRLTESKKIGLYRVIRYSNLLSIIKYNKLTKQFDVMFEKNYNTPRPDLYRMLKTVRGIKEFIE